MVMRPFYRVPAKMKSARPQMNELVPENLLDWWIWRDLIFRAFYQTGGYDSTKKQHSTF